MLFTHSHADHIFGLDELRRFNTLQRDAIPLYGDERTLTDLRRIFSYAFQAVREPGHEYVPRLVPFVARRAAVASPAPRSFRCRSRTAPARSSASASAASPT